jgi:EAL domain-containing protein (putative c-di-GMP-specific phosphodiesterase class I)
VAELKIDRSFVANLLISPSDAEIVRSTIELAQRLSITVVAEGVENPAILERLTEYGCHVAQGFHLARPLTATEFHAWLTTRESGGARATAA